MNKLIVGMLLAAGLTGCASLQPPKDTCYEEVSLDGREYAKYQEEIDQCHARNTVVPSSDGGMTLSQMIGTAFAGALHKAAIRAEVRSWEKD